MENFNKLYCNSSKSWFETTEEDYLQQKKKCDAFRKKEQRHKRCCCPKSKRWTCDMDCLLCNYHCNGDHLYFTDLNKQTDADIFECIPNNSQPIDKALADQDEYERITKRFMEIDPLAPEIIHIYRENDSHISDREVARKLGINDRTFAYRMKKDRQILRAFRKEFENL